MAISLNEGSYGLLLDPLNYDLQILNRFNRLLETLDHALTPDEMRRILRMSADCERKWQRRNQ